MMRAILAVFTIIALTGCQSAYYAAWEKVGVEKRDILVDRVENAKESQEDAHHRMSAPLWPKLLAISFLKYCN